MLSVCSSFAWGLGFACLSLYITLFFNVMHTDTSSSYRVQHLAALCGHCQTYVFILTTVDFVHWATIYSMFCYHYTVLPSVYHVSFMFRFPGVQRWLLFSRLVTVWLLWTIIKHQIYHFIVCHVYSRFTIILLLLSFQTTVVLWSVEGISMWLLLSNTRCMPLIICMFTLYVIIFHAHYSVVSQFCISWLDFCLVIFGAVFGGYQKFATTFRHVFIHTGAHFWVGVGLH